MTKEQIGAEVKATRKSLGMIQIDFAAELDVTQSRLSKIEHGQLELTATEYLRFLQLKEKKS